jgi:hypothetical protein
LNTKQQEPKGLGRDKRNLTNYKIGQQINRREMID